MHSGNYRGRQGGRAIALIAIMAAFCAFGMKPAGLNVVMTGSRVSVEMKIAFLEMTFDFGQSRSKSNSALVRL